LEASEIEAQFNMDGLGQDIEIVPKTVNDIRNRFMSKLAY
jgi:hypothetical protein